MRSWFGLRSVALSAAWILVGSVEPARLIASARTRKPCMARRGVVEVVAGLLLVHLVDPEGGRAGLADVPGRAVDRPLRDAADRLQEGRVREAGIVADEHGRLVAERLHRLHVKD